MAFITHNLKMLQFRQNLLSISDKKIANNCPRIENGRRKSVSNANKMTFKVKKTEIEF